MQQQQQQATVKKLQLWQRINKAHGKIGDIGFYYAELYNLQFENIDLCMCTMVCKNIIYTL